MHLLIISLLKSRGDLAVPKLSPPLCLSEPLPAVLGVCFSALTTQQLHRTAINDIAHGSPQMTFGHCAREARKQKDNPADLVDCGYFDLTHFPVAFSDSPSGEIAWRNEKGA
jgi:hypothetical protein